MKSTNYYILLMFLISLLASCAGINSPEKQYFTGITETNELGPEPIGSIDSTDWLPRFRFLTDDPDIGMYGISIPPAFPNPTLRYTTLRYIIPAKDSINIWLEDESGNQTFIKSEYVLAGRFDEKIDLLYDENGKRRNPGLYRIYFKVITREAIPLVKGDVELRQ